MNERQARRISREVTPTERERLQKLRQQIAEELPDMTARDQLRKEAREEATLSGDLRRAVHVNELSLPTIASRVGIDPIVLDEFLTGERTLRSDVLDRLANVLEYSVTPVRSEA